MRTAVLLFISFSLLQFSMAGTPQGAFISYKYIDSLKYEVKLHYYRSCLDSSLTNAVSVYVKCSNGSDSVKLNMQWQSIKDITPTCISGKKRCDPANTSNTGEGIEEHIFTGIVDFADTTFKAVGSCDEVIFYINECCRSSAITTGITGNLYNYALLNRKFGAGNSSPQLLLPPLFLHCLNQPVFYNIGVIDTLERDSVSYQLATPIGSKYNMVAFVSAYWLSPLKYPYMNVNANPPMGIFSDPETGDVIFTPTKQNEITVMFVRITEWRKDSTGKYKVIGTVHLDQMMYFNTCPDNYPPQATNNDFTYRTCEGERLCFNVTTDDKVYTPPPPISKPPPDTVKLNWSNGIKDATFEILNKGLLHETGRFCWTPPLGSSDSKPYSFISQASDNACPLNALARRSFRIFVKKKAYFSKQSEGAGCNKFAFKITVDSNYSGSRKAYTTVLNAQGGLITDSITMRMISNGLNYSEQTADTVQFYKPGKYILQYSVINLPENCPVYLYDTIVISGNIPDLITLNDTFYCKGQLLSLTTDLPGIGSYSNLRWHTGDKSDTNRSINLVLTQDFLNLKLTIIDSLGCEITDFVNIIKWDSPKVSLGNDTAFCDNNILMLKATPQEMNPWFKSTYMWQDSSISDTMLVTQKGDFWVAVSNFCGTSSDTLTVFDKQNLLKIIPPVHFCETQSVKINSQLTGFRYRWENTSQDTTYQMITNQSGVYSCHIILNCGDTITENIEVVAEKVPQLLLPDSAEFCEKDSVKLNGGVWDQHTTIVWNDTLKDSIRIFTKASTYRLNAKNICGSFTDTTTIWERKIPKTKLGPDLFYCDSVTKTYNFGKSNYDFLWSDSSTNSSIVLNKPGVYWLTISNHCGLSRDSVNIDLAFTPYINLGNDTSLLTPFNIILDAQNLGSKYLWNTGDTTQMIVVKTFGTYKVIVSNRCGTRSSTINISEKVGIEELTSDNINIYPNPGKGKIIVSFDRFDVSTNTTTFGFQVFDMNGKLVPIKYKMLSGGFEIELEQATSGTYLLRWQSGESQFRKVFVVE